MCYRGLVATAALLVIAFVLHPRDTRVIAAICTGGQWTKVKNAYKIMNF